jgi:DNA replication licensing factor MCM5
LIFIVRDEHNEERDSIIARHVVRVHMNNSIQEPDEGDLDIQKMRSYISYCKSKCAPKLTPEAAEKLSSHFVEMRAKVRGIDADSHNAKTAIPITVRYDHFVVHLLFTFLVNWKLLFVYQRH